MTKARSNSSSKPRSGKQGPSSAKKSPTIRTTSGKVSNAEYQRNYRLRKLIDPRIQLRLVAKGLNDEEARRVIYFIKEMSPDLSGATL